MQRNLKGARRPPRRPPHRSAADPRRGGSSPDLLTPTTAIPDIVWPALPTGRDATLLALMQQLEESQWWPPGAIEEMQMRQLEELVEHAVGTVPFYRDRFAALAGMARGELTAAAWRNVPVLRRADIQDAGPALFTAALPPGHGRTYDVVTSGSTGRPIHVKGSGIVHLFGRAINLRFQFWHQRDFGAATAAIRRLKAGEARFIAAGNVAAWVSAFASGPMHLCDVMRPVDEQVEWLRRLNPPYLLTYPTNLAALVERSKALGVTFPALREVVSMGEVLQQTQRAFCEREWGVRVVDLYSCNELGLIALQCPGHDHYLVQSENLYVEVLDDDGRPCEPGAVGRLVITDLHNFASPLIRYELGDHAEVGGPCPTGRTLPVLTRIMGRSRNMLTLPTGARVWPTLTASLFLAVAPVRQFQVIQRSLDAIEVKLAVARPLTGEQKQKLAGALAAKFGYPFAFTFTEVAEIPHAPSGKYEDFRSELT
ncbi:MAG: phenylacetate--CoA ligase family protein [Rhodospirillales bacterium]